MGDTTNIHRQPAADRSPATESPWYWIYLFATAALVGLAVMGPKMVERQRQNERSFQGRRRAAEQAAGLEPKTQMSTRDDTRFTLQPLIIGLSAVLVVAWTIFWWNRFRTQAPAERDRAERVRSP